MSRYDIGPTIGIDGEAEFRKAIQNINTNIKTLSTEMLAVTSAYDANDKSVAALTSRNEVLTKQIDAQKEKLAKLQEGLAASAEKYGEGDEKTQRWQQAVNAATAELNKMERQLAENTEELDDQGSALDKVKEKASAFGDAMATAAKAAAAAIAAATAAITAFAKSAVDTGMQFDSSMSQVAATMGTTVDQIGELRDFAMEMGATTAFSATEAADALNYMALAGYDAGTSMSMLPTVLDLAAAGGIDLASASDMVTDAQSALGLSVEEAAEMVDKMAMASSKSNTSVAQLGEAILAIGGTAKNVSGGTTELSTALGILADNGIKGAEGGTHLRNIILSLSAPTGVAAEALAWLGVEVFDAAGNMRPLNETLGDLTDAMSSMTQAEQTNLISTIFNKTDIAAVNALLTGTASGFDGISAALESSGVDWERYRDKVWAADSAFEGLIHDLQYNIIELGTSTEDLQEYLYYSYDMDAEDALAAIESVSSAVAESGTRWDELTGYIDEATGAAGQMANTQLDNLAGDITLFKSALEGAQIVLSDQLTPNLREFVQFGSEGVSALSTAFQKDGLSGAMEALGTILSDGLNMVIEQLPVMIDAGMQLLGALGEGLLSNLPTIVSAAMEIITTLSSGLADSLPELIPTVVDVILQIVDTLTDPDNLSNLIDAALEIIVSLATGLIDALPKLAERVPQIIANIVTTLANNLPKITESALKIVTTLGAGLIKAIPQLVKSVPQLVTAIVNAFSSLASRFSDIGKNIVTGVWQGIQSMASWIKEKVSGFFGGIVDSVKGLLGINSSTTAQEASGRAVAGANIARGVPEQRSGDTVSRMANLPALIAETAHQELEGMTKSTGIGFESEARAVQRRIDRSMRELSGNAVASVSVTGGVSGGQSDDVASCLANLPALIAQAVHQEFEGMAVNLNMRKVGEMTSTWQGNYARAMGV